LGFPTGWSFIHHAQGLPDAFIAISTFSGAVAGERNSYINYIFSRQLGTIKQQQAATFSGTVAEEGREDFCEGSSSHTHPLLCYLFCFTLFYFTCIAFYIKNPKKFESLVAVFTCLLSFC
jgi:hypothetical protein